ncbi:MAG: hypothetical protein IJL00_06290 [Clostridia bacterium]|nr:hypothetical protein [Clostridia bacterium]
MSVEELVQKLPSNVFFDFVKQNYKAFFEFFGKVLKVFGVNVGASEE